MAYEVSAVVMILESWMKMAKEGESLDLDERPSESLDRREVVALMGEATGGQQQQKFLPIIRSGNGKFFGFGEFPDPGHKDIQGRFAEILPPKQATQELQQTAKVMLKVMGVTEQKLRSGWGMN